MHVKLRAQWGCRHLPWLALILLPWLTASGSQEQYNGRHVAGTTGDGGTFGQRDGSMNSRGGAAAAAATLDNEGPDAAVLAGGMHRSALKEISHALLPHFSECNFCLDCEVVAAGRDVGGGAATGGAKGSGSGKSSGKSGRQRRSLAKSKVSASDKEQEEAAEGEEAAAAAAEEPPPGSVEAALRALAASYPSDDELAQRGALPNW